MANQRQVTVLQGQVPVLLSQLATIEAADDQIEGKRKMTAWSGCGLALFGAIMFFLMFGAFAAHVVLGLLVMLVAFGALIGAAVIGYLWRGYRAADLDDERLHFARDLLRALEPDLSEKKPVNLTIKHGDLFEFGTQTDGGHAHGARLSTKEDSWFSLAGAFADGSAFKMEMTLSGKRKAKPKRKYTKLKDRTRDEIALAIRAPVEKYPRLEQLQTHLQPERLHQHSGLQLKAMRPEGNTIRCTALTGIRLSVTGRHGTQRYGEEHALTADKVISLLAFMFAALSHCRPDPAAAGAGAPPPTLPPPTPPAAGA